MPNLPARNATYFTAVFLAGPNSFLTASTAFFRFVQKTKATVRFSLEMSFLEIAFVFFREACLRLSASPIGIAPNLRESEANV